MPLNVKPPPDSALLHYPRGFDSEIEFHLRERNPSTMEQTQNMAVDVEVNLKIRGESLKTEKEEKIDSLIKKSEEMIQKITMKAKCLDHQDTSVLQMEKIDIHKQISTNSIYHKSDDRFIEQYVEEKSPDLLCEFDNISSFSNLPKYYQYDDDYVPQNQINFTEESKTILGKRKVQVQQLESSD